MAGRSEKLLTLDLDLRFTTERAYGFKVGGLHAPLTWCPRALVEDDGGNRFTMPEWLVVEKGLDAYVVD